MNVHIKTIPHSKQRYRTCGDWIIDHSTGDVSIYVSALGDWRYELLVAVHELVEVLVCRYRNVPQATVDQFDMWYETERANGVFAPDEEPGDHPQAPYRGAHLFATTLEMALAVALGVDWAAYGEAVVALGRA